MDNRVLNINGKSKEEFFLAMKIAFMQSHGYGKEDTARFWGVHEEHGFVLCNYRTETEHGYVRGLSELPCPMQSEAAANMLWNWLDTDEAKSIKLSSWFKDFPHDGSNSLGWRVYVGEWGHVGDQHGAIVAVTPAYLWHGK